MSGRTGATSQVGVGGGLVLGTGVGATAAVLVGTALAPTVAYGTGAGLAVGALAGRLAEVNRGESHVTTRVVGGTLVLGLIGGSLVGIISAWTADASLINGLGVGAGAGSLHGLLLGGVLAATVGVEADGFDEADG